MVRSSIYGLLGARLGARARGPVASINPPGIPQAVSSRPQPTTTRRPSTGMYATTVGGLTYPSPRKPRLPQGPSSPAAPGVGTPPSVASGTPMPFDATYESAVANANSNYENTFAGLTNSEASVRQDYGIDDASDPFSRAKLLQRSYDTAKRGSTNRFAAMGQLYAGSLQNAQNSNATSYLQGQDALNRSYQAALEDIASRRRDAAAARGDTIENAKAEAIKDALANRPDPADIPASPATAAEKAATAVGAMVGAKAASTGSKNATTVGNHLQTTTAKAIGKAVGEALADKGKRKAKKKRG